MQRVVVMNEIQICRKMTATRKREREREREGRYPSPCRRAKLIIIAVVVVVIPPPPAHHQLYEMSCVGMAFRSIPTPSFLLSSLTHSLQQPFCVSNTVTH
jgi:hypothetical protein